MDAADETVYESGDPEDPFVDADEGQDTQRRHEGVRSVALEVAKPSVAKPRRDHSLFGPHGSFTGSSTSGFLPSFDETWVVPDEEVRAGAYGHLITCDCYLTVSASPSEVKEVCSEWARDLGWSRVKTGDDFLVFDLFRLTLLPSPQLDIAAAHGHGHTKLTFSLSARFHSGQAHFLQDVVDYFADGVATELKRRGYDVQPSVFGWGRQNRRRLAFIETWRARSYLALVFITPAVTLAAFVSMALDRFFLPAFAAFFWSAGLLMYAMYLRWRILGARMSGLLFFVLFCLVCVVVATPLAALGY